MLLSGADLPTSPVSDLPAGAHTPDELFVAHAYRDLLQRPVDSFGLSYWTGALAQGGTRPQVVLGIEQSREYCAGEVQALYSTYLKRPADAMGMNYFVDFLGSGGTMEQAAAQITASQEYFQTRGAGTNAGFLNALYQDALQRPLDPVGQSAFGQMLRSPYDHLYAFGDGLSADGTARAVGGDPVSPLYSGGRYSNGQVWVEYLAQDLGLSADQLTDLADAGAGMSVSDLSTSDTTSTSFSSGLLAQVQQFTNDNPLTDPNALYTVWTGTNDYLRDPFQSVGLEDSGPALSDPQVVVSNISNAVSDLAMAGARNILVVNLPDLGNLPGTRNNDSVASQLSALSTTHDADLDAALGTLRQQLGGVNILSLDVKSLFGQIQANPGPYGFTDATNSAIGNTGDSQLPPSGTTDLGKTNPNALLFWDSIHPTTAGHRLIAQDVLSVLNVGATRAQVTAAVFTSDEFWEDLIQKDYQCLLHRPADALGMAYFTGSLRAGGSDGEVLAEIVSSPECAGQP
jgi:phospholipase/lecithinase/hemolysin